MDITLKNILEDYWSQSLLLLTAIGFILRMTFNFFLKKKEINHGIIHKNRMDALIRFFNAYAELKSMWVKLPIYQIFDIKLTSDEIDGQIQPPLNSFEASIIELQIYFDHDMYNMFKMIETNMLSINSTFLKIAFDVSSDNGIIKKTNDFTSFRQEIERENAAILKNISAELSKKYS